MIIGKIGINKNVINQFNKIINIFDKQKIIYYLIYIFKDIHFNKVSDCSIYGEFVYSPMGLYRCPKYGAKYSILWIVPQ